MARTELYILETRFSFNGSDSSIFPVIISNSSEYILVDCGYEGFLPLLEQAAIQSGTSFQQLTGILISHHDIDHIGGLHEIKAAYPYIKIYSPDLEEAFINGKQKNLRLVQAESMYDSLPDDQKPGALYFQDIHRKIKPVPVNKTFAVNGDTYLMDGVRIMHTPGHMPGHISIYLEASNTVVSADALVYENGELDIANPGFTLDLPAAIASIKKIQALQPAAIVCYHGGLVNTGVTEKLDRLVAKYS